MHKRLNEFDVPKLYFHDLRVFEEDSKKESSKYEYAIIDGKQRLDAVWKFIDGDFPLSDEFEYLKDAKVKAGSLTYGELANKYPSVKQIFDATNLSVFVVQTDDLDLIEEMFSRLNEAVPLNAAERRNAFGGPLPNIARDIAATKFFKNRIRISNRRYQHRDLAAKLVYLTYSGSVLDTKNVYRDAFFKANRHKERHKFRGSILTVRRVLLAMAATFTEKDELLKSSSMVVLYYLLFLKSIDENWRQILSRSRLTEFERVRSLNRIVAEGDIAMADYDLLEFDRLTQTPNDGYALKFRLDLLEQFVRGKMTSKREMPS